MQIQALTQPPLPQPIPVDLEAASLYQDFLGPKATINDGAMFIIGMEHFMNAMKSINDSIAQKGLDALKQEAQNEAQGT